jgi:protein-disulfide isomerase
MTAHARPDPLLQADEAIDHILGPASAAVTLLEYGDFQSPSCGHAHAVVKILLAHFGRQLRFVYRHFPQREVHPYAELAAEAAEAAAAQGHFWPFCDLLFAHQQHLKEKSLQDYAQQLDLDMARFQYEMKDHVYLQRVQEHLQGAQRLAVHGTPTFYVNGHLIDVSSGFKPLRQAIERALL